MAVVIALLVLCVALLFMGFDAAIKRLDVILELLRDEVIE